MTKMMRPGAKNLPIAVTVGEPAGIGPEIVLKAWMERRQHHLQPFCVVGCPDFLANQAKHLKWDIPIQSCGFDNAINAFDHALPVVALSEKMQGGFGRPDAANATLVIEAIETGVSAIFSGQVSSIVTAPINKKLLYDAGFNFAGHTEFLASLAETATGSAVRPVMMLAGPLLRAIPVTIHIPLSDVPKALSIKLIVETCQIASKDLSNRFGIARPRLAVSGLNPHAGEDGSMGREDRDIILPAIAQLMAEGIDVVGPLPADTMFHASARKAYDVAICMYHDQALIPAKTLGFDDAVNVTLGLPFIRTSPDHGTAFDIAGRGIANPSSMIAALKMAQDMSAAQALAGVKQ